MADFLKSSRWGNVLAKMATQQVLSFIQSKIAEARTAGEDILSLLANPEIAFCLKVLDEKRSNAEQVPNNKASEENINTGMEQLLKLAGTNTK